MGMVILSKKEFKVKEHTIRSYYDCRNKLLINREYGGLGDIFMHRMIFEDFKKLNPEMEVTFACPRYYFDAVSDHPFIDKIVDTKTVSLNDYGISYNTSSACGRYENAIAPRSDKHRSDIWAEHCGVNLENHDMNFIFTKDELSCGEREAMRYRNGGPLVAICPVTAMATKNFTSKQLDFTITYLKNIGATPVIVNNVPVINVIQKDTPQYTTNNIRKWMCFLKSVNYIISADTGSFHFGGGIKKPMLGMFTFADGVTYGKYYDFILVQKHRKNGNWDCGPCYNYGQCPKSRGPIKPCLTEITTEEIEEGLKKMFDKWSFK